MEMTSGGGDIEKHIHSFNESIPLIENLQRELSSAQVTFASYYCIGEYNSYLAAFVVEFVIFFLVYYYYY